MRVVLGVSGGIAAYKAAFLLRLFTESGDDVTVVPTEAALRFVGAPTWEALSGSPVQTGVFERVDEVVHVRLGQEADLVVVAPATADLLARAAHGQADDLLTTTLLVARCPVVLAPAMHTEMWEHPATVANVATLRSRGIHVIEPASGRLTGTDTGPGRLPEPQDIHAAALAVVGHLPAEGAAAGTSPEQDLRDVRVLVTLGGTREPIDPVRFLGNRSSGKQGVAIVEEALSRGASVTAVVGSTDVPLPAGCTVVDALTALDMDAAVRAHEDDADVVVMAAAVADFRPRTVAAAKIKKRFGEGEPEAPTIELVRNPDVLAGLVDRRGSADAPLVVGFAAETGDADGGVLDHARAKLARKGCDVLVVNEVGPDKTFGRDETVVHVLRRGTEDAVEIAGSKREVARRMWDVLRSLAPRR